MTRLEAIKKRYDAVAAESWGPKNCYNESTWQYMRHCRSDMRLLLEVVEIALDIPHMYSNEIKYSEHYAALQIVLAKLDEDV